MYKKAWHTIKNANSILLVSHTHPDGDTLGSVLGLYSVLRGMKKSVSLYNGSKIMPKRLDFLPNINRINDRVTLSSFDVVVVCDCGSLDRTEIQSGNFTLINIDHHTTNENFGDINVVDPLAPSATMVVYELLRANNIPITKEVALCLYVGFVEDTGFFSYGNITQKSLEAIAHLVGLGLDLAWVGMKMKQATPLSFLRLKQHVLNAFYLLENATIGVVEITQEDLKRTGSLEDDTKNIINPLRELATVQLAIMVLEKKSKGAKISLRSKENIDASAIALTFGGGGHKRAAGFEVAEFKPKKIVQTIVNRLNTQVG